MLAIDDQLSVVLRIGVHDSVVLAIGVQLSGVSGNASQDSAVSGNGSHFSRAEAVMDDNALIKSAETNCTRFPVVTNVAFPATAPDDWRTRCASETTSDDDSVIELNSLIRSPVAVSVALALIDESASRTLVASLVSDADAAGAAEDVRYRTPAAVRVAWDAIAESASRTRCPEDVKALVAAIAVAVPSTYFVTP